MPTVSRRSAATARWHTAAQVLAVMRQHPGISRAAMAQRIGLTRGLATEVTARLRAAHLLTEEPAPLSGRGRPTTVLRPHPEGPVVLAVHLRHEEWHCAVAALDGTLGTVDIHRHDTGSPDGRSPAAVLDAIRRTVEQTYERYGHRLRAVSLAAPAAIHSGHLAQASTLGWGPVDTSVLTAGLGVPLLVGNDATLAGVAEARTGAAVTAGTALHLIVEVGVGGTLTVDGHPVTGGHGAAGEYGHLPFGDRTLACPCGARGCWDLEVDGRALARHLGEPEPGDPRRHALAVLGRTDDSAREAVAAVAASLGAGVAALVNAHDPDIVTLGGLAIPLRRAAAFGVAYRDGLMSLHRADPATIVDAVHGDDGPLQGAVVLGLDHATSEPAIADWADRHRSR
ncbi:putative NBD/HSP70 family sugar kinase [Actinoplanes campanulatus]|uniref:Putative NBD/HSP70 family sugar kinase n=1 Tax=Actinoplanes campanulatus TaxID=113559 RepID=A0A7W5FJA9_9ACTN|nr:ROK family transcriptional regulator [Actinoplanes campanulatus]MBB3100315.1 putative NBD/HSP70 family sugar kinase [Actinoplanes campanulatus]GGN43912.1 xylose repressor [Actinoplanes campanulatus]GID40883.1 xylose repressor [Actinoplanes campanulatus]